MADIVDWNCTACAGQGQPLTDINVTTADGHLAYVGWDHEKSRIQVVLRGSTSISDWIKNLDYFKTPAYGSLGCDGCEVHRGFLESYQALQPGVEASVDQLLKSHPGASIAIVGHSMGAAMAAHAAVGFGLVRGDIVDGPVYTFGQPRVGDAAFAKWFHGKFPKWLRSVHWNDPVPHLPPSKSPLPDGGRFHHFGRELWWDSDGESQAMVCDDSGEDPNCSQSISVALAFTDHWYYLGKKVVQCTPFK